MIVIPENNIEYNIISNTTKHEARHAYYNTQRKLKSTTAFDSSVLSLDRTKPLGEATGYSEFQSYEEVSNHSKDLLSSFRTGNREILKLYQSHELLGATQILDLGFLDGKVKVVKNISDQTIRTADAALAEIERMKAGTFENIRLTVEPTDQGYFVSFPVNDVFDMRTYLSSKSEKALAKNFIDHYASYANREGGVAYGAAVNQDIAEEFRKTLSALSEKISQTRLIAKETQKDAVEILNLVDAFYAGADLSIDRKRYLQIRDLLARPAHRVSGLMTRDQQEYEKALIAIREKRKARRPDSLNEGRVHINVKIKKVNF